MQRKEEKFLRLTQELEIIPVSRSSWWKGCKTGKYPKSIKLGARSTAWKSSEIQALINKVAGDSPKDT